MAEWYVKDLSKLTHISVQTLHHYDRIDLLKPSVRLDNGYRLYSEKDLLKLQQIIALKFFGFELAQIKKLIAAEIDIIEHFSAQSAFLEEQAKTMQEASQALQTIISDCKQQQSIPWETIIKLIEVYRMSHELEKTWAGKVFNSQELKDYARFENELNTKYTAEEKAVCEQEWLAIVGEVESNLQQDPSSATGIRVGKRCMDWVMQLYGSEFANLRHTMWEKGFKGGHAAEEHMISMAGVQWLDVAIKAYYGERIRSLLTHIDAKTPALWEALLTEICGDNQQARRDLIEAVLKNDKLSQAGKDLIKKS